MDLTSFTIDNSSLGDDWFKYFRREITTANMESELTVCRVVSNMEKCVNLSTHVINLPVDLIGAYQVDQRERQHWYRGKDHQTLDQTPPENATLRAITSHEMVFCKRVVSARFTRMPFWESTASNHQPFKHWKFNLASAFCPRLVPAEVIQSTHKSDYWLAKFFWIRSCTQPTNSTIIDDSNSSLVCFTNRCKLSAMMLLVMFCLYRITNRKGFVNDCTEKLTKISAQDGKTLFMAASGGYVTW